MQKVPIMTALSHIFNPKNIPKRGMNMHFQTSKQTNHTFAYHSDSNQVLHSDKDLQVLLKGNPKMCLTSYKSKKAEGRHFKNH